MTTSREDRPAVYRAGRLAWAVLGILALAAVLLWVIGEIRVVVVPLVIALFPAALLAPVSSWLKRRGLPAALAALLTVAGGLGVLVGLGSLVIPLVAAQAPVIAESVREALADLQSFLSATPLAGQLDLLDQPLENLGERVGDGGNVADQTVSAVRSAFEVITETLLMIIAVFFYLKDGSRIRAALVTLVPQRLRDDVAAVADRIWSTVGAYFRGQLLVAAADALGIGLGLLILGVPLVIPLTVLVLIGGMFPIVGAFVSGSVAVLVALADQGLVTALLVLAVVIGVQQLEGNVLEPLILSRAIHLHPLVVLASIAAGAVTLGILGAFLAVPVAASVARAVEYVRGGDGEVKTA